MPPTAYQLQNEIRGCGRTAHNTGTSITIFIGHAALVQLPFGGNVTNRGRGMRTLAVAAAMAALVAGCATTKDWAATGGSRSDGVVRLSYELGEFEKPQLNEQQAIEIATQRCKTWGYSGAEAFGGVTRQCNQGGGFAGCSRWMITKEYQCTGTGAPSN